jgi:steroid 5-alpha reductase family enzyme
MFTWSVYLDSLLMMGTLGLVGWLYSLARQNVTIVDSMWSLFFLLAVLTPASQLGWMVNERGALIAVLVTLWSTRLAVFLTKRNFGHTEDLRYQKIRSNNEPFWIKSLYIVFGLQVILAWLISLPLHGATLSTRPLTLLDGIGTLLWTIGFFWEVVGDRQLAKFKANPGNRGKVMNQGLWRYSRHPNYFGECALWWGYYLIALSGGAWWSLPAPILMTLLLLKVSGVALLESTIVERRPSYAEYIRRTNAFIPWFPRKI